MHMDAVFETFVLSSIHDGRLVLVCHTECKEHAHMHTCMMIHEHMMSGHANIWKTIGAFWGLSELTVLLQALRVNNALSVLCHSP